MSTAAILCDTGALLDYLVATAPDHRAFREAIDRSRTRYVPGLVLAEVDYFLRKWKRYCKSACRQSRRARAQVDPSRLDDGAFGGPAIANRAPGFPHMRAIASTRAASRILGANGNGKEMSWGKALRPMKIPLALGIAPGFALGASAANCVALTSAVKLSVSGASTSARVSVAGEPFTSVAVFSWT